ncbi:MAG: penicillin-binding Tp47 domain C-containing protein [Lachnospiraceae bacterium]|nr:penicillin-binding Tp47 domain C-containing protein [Lachnospiraceae bacterium]
MHLTTLKKALAITLSAAMIAVASPVVTPLNAVAVKAETSDHEYTYLYSSLSWSEYWANEGVYAAGDASSSDETDTRGETDKGAFDAVSRATTNHGLHRGNYQCDVTIYDTDGHAYNMAYWSEDGSTIYLRDGSSIGFSRGEITKNDGATATMDHYLVNGLKYVPVKVAAEDLDDFVKTHDVVYNGEELKGGYSENQLAAYTYTANVTSETNGLKTVSKNADGTYSFSARSNGTESGLKDVELKKASDIVATVKDASGSYGEFLRVDLTGDGYGALGAAMQEVQWTYYGNDGTRTNALATYGTKFAADNWMHKAMGIQLGLTDSARCKLPEGYDGTGYWSLKVIALGYEDYTVDFEASVKNIVGADTEASAEEIEALTALVNEADALKADDYKADKNWSDFQTELQETKDLLAKDIIYSSEITEQTEHLTNAMNALVEKAGSKVTLKAKTVTYTGKAVSIGEAAVTGSTGKVSYKYYSDSKCKKAVSASKVKNAGTYYVKATVAADDNYKAATSSAVKLTIKKASQKIKVSTAAKTVKYAKVKKAKQVTSKVSVSGAKTSYTYKKAGGSSQLSIDKKSGKITMKKGTKKGTYSIKVKVTASDGTNYDSASKTATVKVKVK